MRYEFAGLEFDEETFELRRAGQRVAVQPKALVVLGYLIRNRERVVSSGELLDAVWQGVAVQANTVAQTLVGLRRALEGADGGPGVIQTVRTRGYRFVAEVAETRATGARDRRALFGRDTTLRLFEEEAARMLAGETRLVLLSGAAGIGKTRLLRECGALLAKHGVLCTLSSPIDADGTPDLFPWTRALRELALAPSAGEEIGRAGPFSAELRLLVPELGPMTGGEREAPHPAPADRFRLFDDVVRLLARLSEAQPLALLFDDFHCIDAASLVLLQFTLKELAGRRVLLVAAYSEEALPEHTVRALGRLSRHEAVRVHALPALDEEAVAAVAEHVLGADPTPERRRRLFEKSGGNPVLLMQLLSTDGRGERETAASETSELLAASEIREAIGVQLGSLDDGARRVLRHAAVLGVEFDFSDLGSLGIHGEGVLLDALDRAVRGRVLAKRGAAGYRFVHGLVADVLYRELPSRERKTLHETLAARAPRTSPPTLAASLEAAAHAARAVPIGGIDLALDLAVRASQQADAEGERALAVPVLERAARLLPFASRVGGKVLARFSTELRRLRATPEGDGLEAALLVVSSLERAGAGPPEPVER